MKLVTADQVRTLDQQATKAGVPVEKLMENADRGQGEPTYSTAAAHWILLVAAEASA